jgi:hypothetical protein
VTSLKLITVTMALLGADAGPQPAATSAISATSELSRCMAAVSLGWCVLLRPSRNAVAS